MKVDSAKSWLTVSLMFIASIQIIMLPAVIYGDYSGGNITPTLNVNFIMFLILGFGSLMFFLIIIVIKYLLSIGKLRNFDADNDNNDKWNKEW